MDAKGRMYVASVATNRADVVMSRYTTEGAPDEAWGPGGQRIVSGASFGIDRVTTMHATADGGLLVAGRRFTQGGAVDVALARLSL